MSKIDDQGFMFPRCVYNVVKFKRRRLLLLSLLVGFCCTLFFPAPNPLLLAELDKCPACYGLSACREIHHVDLPWQNARAIFSHLFGVKNVYFGMLNGSRVILKKLAHNAELEAFDLAFCTECSPCSKILRDGQDERASADLKKLIRKAITPDFSKDDSSRLRLCPTARRMDDLFRNLSDSNKHTNSTQHLINLWTLLSINPEPLILQILLAEDGWPVPRYFGACGRIVIEEYVGSTLADYYNEPWIRRAKIALSLLNAAHAFTFGNEDFGFYLTDVSSDNIAVDEEDIAKFIDLENVIVVDKNTPSEERPKTWEELQKNVMHLECPNCFAFSPEDICNHHLSDHNYYAICQLLAGNDDTLTDGFLHDMPIDIKQRYPSVEYLLQQCVVPDSANSRITSSQRLEVLLNTLLKESS